MKKIILSLILYSFSSNLISQTKEETVKILNKVENSKSGNLIDAFGGFYQLAFKSININEKSLDLNATLFSLVNNYDADILVTKNRKSIVFLRNFQINGKLNLNDKLNFNGYSAGFTYAILNKRDQGFIDIDDSDFAKQTNELNSLINNVIVKIVPIEMDNFKKKNNRDMDLYETKKLSYDISEASTAIRNGKTVEPGLQKIHDDIINELNKEISNSEYFQKLKDKNGQTLTNIETVNKHLQQLKNDFLKNLEKKPFLSISSNAITDKDGKLNQGSAEMIFLAGNRFGEFDVRAKYNYLDTISPSMPRSNFNGKIGYNFKILKNKEDKSFFEIKAYGEYNKILKNILPNEKEETILANADFRFRLTDDLWIPLTVKYDTETSNFLGFLNVTYNFGGFK